MADYLHIKQDIILLILLGVANSAPIFTRVALKGRLSTPIDLGMRFFDGRQIFGVHKTFRGVVSSLVSTSFLSLALGYSLDLGLRLALFSMGADLGTSFLKRRLGLRSGARATGLDQIPEALLPLWLLRQEVGITYWDIFCVVFLFFILEVSLSPLLYALRIRRAPY